MDGMINIYRNVITRCTSFSGRINRRQYWIFLVAMLLIMMVTIWFTDKMPALHLYQIYGLLMILPYVSSTVKRLHDIGKRGWWMLSILVPIFGWIYLFVLTIEDGKESDNKYGKPEDWSIL